MKKNEKQGDLFGGYQPERELSAKDICEIFNGKIITQEQFDEEIRLVKVESREQSGEWLIKKVRQEGVCWWVKPRNIN